jgi:hypothetical protein
MHRMELRHVRHFAATTEELHGPRAACAARSLEEPKALRWRATFRSRASLGARSAICAGTAFDVNGDHVTSPVASHAAAEVSPPIPTASPRPVLLQWLGAHGIVSLAYASNRAQIRRPASPGPPRRAEIGRVIALQELEMPNRLQLMGSGDIPRRCCGRVNA